MGSNFSFSSGFIAGSIMTVNEHEIYPNAPIVWMAVEIRHPACEPLNQTQVLQLSKQVQEILPLPGQASTVSIEIQGDADGSVAQRQTSVTFPRWTSRDKRTALSVKPDSLQIETTDYRCYERVRELLSTALCGRIDVAVPAGVERIGLRYVDEIRVPPENGNSRPEWQEWIDPTLVGPVQVGLDCGLTPEGNDGVVVFSGVDGQALAVRYGAQVDYAVQSTDLLRRPLPPPGPLFRLDIDSYWQPSDEVPEFDRDRILDLADTLHKPVREVFERLITSRLREEVLRNA